MSDKEKLLRKLHPEKFFTKEVFITLKGILYRGIRTEIRDGNKITWDCYSDGKNYKIKKIVEKRWTKK